MSPEKKEEIIQKILKLMELGNEEKNSNPNEREAAMRKVAQLMADYALDYADLKSSEPKENSFVKIESVDGTESRTVDFEAALAGAVGMAFDCKVINTHRDFGWQMAFVGAKHDLEIAVYFFKFLRRTMYAMARLNVTRENVRPSIGRNYRSRINVEQARRNYCYGLVVTISQRLQDIYKRREEFIPSDSKALVVIKKDEVDRVFREAFPRAVAGRRSTLKGDLGAYRKGQEDGHRVNLTRPISHDGAAATQIG